MQYPDDYLSHFNINESDINTQYPDYLSHFNIDESNINKYYIEFLNNWYSEFNQENISFDEFIYHNIDEAIFWMAVGYANRAENMYRLYSETDVAKFRHYLEKIYYRVGVKLNHFRKDISEDEFNELLSF
jgi:hypothetical protein